MRVMTVQEIVEEGLDQQHQVILIESPKDMDELLEMFAPEKDEPVRKTG